MAAPTTSRYGMRRLVLAIAATGTLVAGCGDDDGSEARSVGRDEFQRAVNGLCEEEHVRVDAMFDGFPEEPTPDVMQQLIGEFADSFRAYHDGLVDVGPPEGLEARYDEYVQAVTDQLADLERGAEDPAEAERLFNQEGEDPLGDLERDLGLDVCASR